jgi:alkanesulfonate monooxygenase
MTVRIIGMIGVSPPQAATVHVIAGGISREWIATTARAHEDAGFDEVLVGYHSSSADGFSVATYAGCHTERLSYLVAHRPGRLLPALAARKIATIDQLLQGRISLHVIIGASDADQAQEGDFSMKAERYARGGEYLDVIRRIWTSPDPVDFEGRFYRVTGAYSEIKPYQQPYPTLLFGGSSPEALDMGAQFCDTFAMFGEPLKETGERVDDFRRRCQAHGRDAKFNVSFRPIIADTEGAAWDKAHRILADLEGRPVPKAETAAASLSNRRLAEVASRGDIHDERLWTPIAAATGGQGNTTCLVGTPQQVADAILKYYELGVSSFLLRGFEPQKDVPEYGRELIPAIRAGAVEIDRRRAARVAQPAELTGR